MDCVFCAIVAGTAPASVVHSDERVLAFMDIRPVVPGHLLVVPRRHAVGLADLDPEDGARVFEVARTLTTALRHPTRTTGSAAAGVGRAGPSATGQPAAGPSAAGVNLFLADGVAAGQEVFHVHLHLLPRNPGDGFRLRFDARTPPRAELDATAAAIRALAAPSPHPSHRGSALRND